MDVLVSLLDLVVLVVTLGCALLCLLKGRAAIGWFGLFMLGSGLALSFDLFRLLRDVEVDFEGTWTWILWSQKLAVAALLAYSSRAPGQAGSWWDRRHHQQAVSN